MIARSYGKIMFSFERNHKTVQVSVPFYIPNSNEWEFLMLHIRTSI